MGAEEKKYPIYSVSLRWQQDGDHDPEYPRMSKGLLAGRIHNSTTVQRMLRSEMDTAIITEEHRQAMAKNEKYRDKNITNLQITVKLLYHETWCLLWFAHYTFDTGQTDAEALASFERYVRRMERINAKHKSEVNDSYAEKYCLMGAEDRWRWYGAQDKEGNRTDAPCRCEGCKKAGRLIIGH